MRKTREAYRLAQNVPGQYTKPEMIIMQLLLETSPRVPFRSQIRIKPSTRDHALTVDLLVNTVGSGTGLGLVVRIMGFYYHGRKPHIIKKDMTKRRALEADNYRVLDLWWEKKVFYLDIDLEYEITPEEAVKLIDRLRHTPLSEIVTYKGYGPL